MFIPFLFSRARVFSPIPQIFFSGSESIKFSSFPSFTSKNPSGFFISEASFARYFVGASPIETVSPVSFFTSSFIFLPFRLEVQKAFLFL